MILYLTLKKKWFDMIASGEKKEEYRENKGYWWNRFNSDSNYHRCTECNPKTANCPSCGFYLDKFKTPINIKQYDAIMFKNGYGKNAPSLLVECKGIKLGLAKPEWSDNFKDECFVISLGRIISTNNINQ